ncbi:UDP-N-acetylglucosamine-peptide N-acetylglucosaminyltransferase, partial [Xanthomonas citri pv. citri]
VVPVDGLAYQAAAERMAQDSCDIIIDLKGWTAGTRSAILASRPAPLQVQWLGYPSSMGASWIDYVIADSVVIPAGEERRFSEKIIRLPDTYQPNDRKRAIGPTRSRADYGLPDGGLVFCSFNQPYKITPQVFDTWMQLLRGAPGSVLWLLKDAD